MTCLFSRDTITQADGKPLPNFYETFDDVFGSALRTVTSWCRVEDGTWVAWWDRVEGDGIDVPGQQAPFGISQDKTTWPAEIESTFAVGVGYFPDDGSGPVVYSLPVSPKFIWGGTGFYSDHAPCRIATFPSTITFSDQSKSELWGWTMAVGDVQVRADGANVWVVVLAQEEVMYPYLSNVEHADACGNLHPSLYEYALAEGLVPGDYQDPFLHDTMTGNRFWYHAADDAGPGKSFRWSPYRVTVWGGDIGGFTRIDTVEARFANVPSFEPNGFPLPGFADNLCSGIQCAASPAEPGVLHLVWAEAGLYGEKQANVGQRINYTRWSPSSKDLDVDLRSTSETAVGFVSDGLAHWISDENWCWTGEIIVRNDHGSPCAIVFDWVVDGGPQYVDPGCAYWDLSGGAADVVQVASPDLFPTEAEGVGSPAQGAPSPFFFDRGSHASSLYTDPRRAGTDVYLICAGFANFGKAFWRIPCDGSDTFDYMDGIRKPGYSIMGDTVVGDRTGVPFFYDFVSDPGNVWMPAGDGLVLHLDRQCPAFWEELPAFPDADPTNGGTDGVWGFGHSSVLAIVTDDAGRDWLVGGGNGPVAGSNALGVTDVAALWAKICRCCVPCNTTGLHVWQVL